MIQLQLHCMYVIKEPVVREADASTGDDGLQFDLGIRGAGQPQVEQALFGDKRCRATSGGAGIIHCAPGYYTTWLMY